MLILLYNITSIPTNVIYFTIHSMVLSFYPCKMYNNTVVALRLNLLHMFDFFYNVIGVEYLSALLIVNLCLDYFYDYIWKF